MTMLKGHLNAQQWLRDLETAFINHFVNQESEIAQLHVQVATRYVAASSLNPGGHGSMAIHLAAETVKFLIM